MPFKEIQRGDDVANGAVAICCHDCDCMQQHYEPPAVRLWIVTTHNVLLGDGYSLPTWNRPRAIHKHIPHHQPPHTHPHPYPTPPCPKHWGVFDTYSNFQLF